MYELYTEKAEVDALVSLVGPKGVSYIENSLLKKVESRLVKVCTFLVNESEVINEFKQNYRKGKAGSASSTDEFLSIMKEIGFYFVIIRR